MLLINLAKFCDEAVSGSTSSKYIFHIVTVNKYNDRTSDHSKIHTKFVSTRIVE
jgi:hypothetical protein